MICIRCISQLSQIYCQAPPLFTPRRYGIRGTAPLSDLTRALRSELYTTPYESINWDAQRNNCASIDLYAPHTVSTGLSGGGHETSLPSLHVR